MKKQHLYLAMLIFFVVAFGYGLMTEGWTVATIALIGTIATLVYRQQLSS